MTRSRLLAAPLALLLIVVGLQAQAKKGDKSPPKADAAAPTLATAQGAVVKADRDALTVRPRGADGRFAKEVVLQVTGSSKVTVLTTRMQAGKQVMVQQDGDVKDLQPQQMVAVIYAEGSAGTILLSAVALPK